MQKLSLAVILGLSLAIVACGDKANDTDNENASVAGTWTLVKDDAFVQQMLAEIPAEQQEEVTAEQSEAIRARIETNAVTWELKADGTWNLEVTSPDLTGVGDGTFTESGTYTVHGNEIHTTSTMHGGEPIDPPRQEKATIVGDVIHFRAPNLPMLARFKRL